MYLQVYIIVNDRFWEKVISLREIGRLIWNTLFIVTNKSFAAQLRIVVGTFKKSIDFFKIPAAKRGPNNVGASFARQPATKSHSSLLATIKKTFHESEST